MKLSLGQKNSNTDFVAVDVAENELEQFITKHNYSTSIFKNNYRNNDNFISTDLIALDIDGGMDLETAKDVFKDYKYVIGTTRNHQKRKKGFTCDRFRIILFLKDKICELDKYYSTIIKLMSKYPNADPQCKDPARLFYPSTVTATNNGKLVEPVDPPPKIEKDDDFNTVTGKGQFSRMTSELLIFGADSNWNHRLFKAAKDIQEQGYGIEEVTKLLTKRTCNYKEVSQNDIDKTIKSAFKDDPKHPKRGNSAFEFKNIKQLFEEKPRIDWLVDRMLSEGGISVIAGPPKSGKSTIIRQLSVATAQGGNFLGRDLKQGPVVYLALEEQEALVYSQFKSLGVVEDDPIVFHAGPPFKNDPFPDFADYIHRNGPRLAVIDTLVMFADIVDQNNYREVYQAITKYRTLARDTGCHIVCVHHTNKGGGMMGSTAFTGAVDAIMYFEQVAGRRFLTTEGRGTANFNKQPLVYNSEIQRYDLGGDNGF